MSLYRTSKQNKNWCPQPIKSVSYVNQACLVRNHESNKAKPKFVQSSKSKTKFLATKHWEWRQIKLLTSLKLAWLYISLYKTNKQTTNNKTKPDVLSQSSQSIMSTKPAWYGMMNQIKLIRSVYKAANRTVESLATKHWKWRQIKLLTSLASMSMHVFIQNKQTKQNLISSVNQVNQSCQSSLSGTESWIK